MNGAPPPGRATFGDGLIAAAFALALAIPAVLGGAFGSPGGESPPSPGALLLGAAVPALFALALLARRARRAGVPLEEAAGYPAARRAAGRDIARGALCGAMTAFALAPLMLWFVAFLARHGIEPPAQRVAEAVLLAGTPGGLAACAAAILLVAPLGEEMLYRALLLRGLRARLPAAVAVPLATLFFAAMHLSPAHAPGLFLAGLLFSVLYDRGSLALSFGAHAAFNAVNLCMLLA